MGFPVTGFYVGHDDDEMRLGYGLFVGSVRTGGEWCASVVDYREFAGLVLSNGSKQVAGGKGLLEASA